MAKDVRGVHHADRRRAVMMPYAPALLVRRGALLFLSSVTAAAPVHHGQPHREEEFDLPRTMREQPVLAMENLEKTLAAAGCTMKDLVSSTRYLTVNE
jgi:enamine deaminase RidA (YjgF/YER057c/UK114 family)